MKACVPAVLQRLLMYFLTVFLVYDIGRQNRLLRALGATDRTIIFWAGGEPFGGAEALKPLVNKFPLLYNKNDIALPGELKEFETRKSMLAAIDYLVCLKSDLFIPSHGGNMGRAVKVRRHIKNYL